MTSINRQTVTWSQEPCRTVDRPFVHDNLVCKDFGGEAGADYARINLDPRLDRKIATRSEIKRLGVGHGKRGGERAEKITYNERTIHLPSGEWPSDGPIHKEGLCEVSPDGIDAGAIPGPPTYHSSRSQGASGRR